jgi:outer membrane lipoprotein-sorting protein
MAKNELDRILNSLGGEETPDDVRRMAEDLAGRFRRDLIQTEQHKHSIWREHIMRNRIAQLAVAAAIITAVSVGLYHLGFSPGSAGVAWGDVLAKVENIAVVTYKMKLTMTYPEGRQWVDESDIYVGGEYGSRIDSYKDGQLYMIKHLVPARKVLYIVHPQLKRYMERALSDEQAAAMVEQQDPRQWVRQILAQDYSSLGRSEIDGVEVEGIEAKRENETLRLWVDVKTNWPIRIESEGQMMNEGQLRPSRIVLDHFQWDAELDPSLFEPKIPADYTLSGPR